MNVIRKIAPVGIDKIIDRIQTVFEDKITFANFNCYPRIYKEETERGVIPMNYIGNGEYKEVFFNDKLNGSCFFYEENTRNADKGFFKNVKLSVIFQVKLKELMPTITHRADEEIHSMMGTICSNIKDVEVSGLVTTVKNVYSEFETKQVLNDDIGNNHVFRIDLRAKVKYCN